MDQNKSVKPEALYFDTNFLRKFTPHFNSPGLKKVISLCDTLDIKLYIPETAVKELACLCRLRIEKIINHLRELGAYNIFKHATSLEEFTNLKSDVRKYVNNMLKKLNIIIVPTPSICFDDLMNMAINYRAPFAPEDKGFKDAVILFTILASSETLQFKSIFLITDDPIFRDNYVETLAKKRGITLRILSKMEDVIDVLTQALSREVRELYEQKGTAIKEFLDNQLPIISDYIRKTGYSSLFFRKSKKWPLSGTLVSVKDINILKIDRVFVTKEIKQNGDTKIEIYFLVETNFNLLVKIYSIKEMYSPYFYLESETLESERRIMPKDGYPEERIDEIEIKIGVSVEAALLFRKPNLYSNLQIKEQTAYFI